MLQETVQRFPMSCAMRFFGSDWHGVADGLILNVGLTLFMITGCPFPVTASRFPMTLFVNSQWLGVLPGHR